MSGILKNLIGGKSGAGEAMEQRDPGVVAETLAAGVMSQNPFAENAPPLPAGPIPFRPGPFNPFAERFDEVVQAPVEVAEKWSVKLEVSNLGAVVDGMGLTGSELSMSRVAEGLRLSASFKF